MWLVQIQVLTLASAYSKRLSPDFGTGVSLLPIYMKQLLRGIPYDTHTRIVWYDGTTNRRGGRGLPQNVPAGTACRGEHDGKVLAQEDAWFSTEETTWNPSFRDRKESAIKIFLWNRGVSFVIIGKILWNEMIAFTIERPVSFGKTYAWYWYHSGSKHLSEMFQRDEQAFRGKEVDKTKT